MRDDPKEVAFKLLGVERKTFSQLLGGEDEVLEILIPEGQVRHVVFLCQKGGATKRLLCTVKMGSYNSPDVTQINLGEI